MDGDITMCGEGTGSINAKEKTGFVKEYIETEGLAMILSKEYGLILFHLDSVWVEGMKFDAAKTRAKMVPGTEVKFYDKTYKGAEYKELSEDQLIHQAVAVWTGERPDHLLKKIQDEEYKKKLEEHRKSFMLYLRGEVFLRAALVRVKGEVAGYLSDNMGIIEHKDEKDKKINIFFHTDDVIVFKKNIREYNQSPKQLLPVGCLVSVDARRVHISGIKNVEYQVSQTMWLWYTALWYTVVQYCVCYNTVVQISGPILWYNTVVQEAVMFLSGNLRVGRFLALVSSPHSLPRRPGLRGSELRITQRNIHLLLPGARSGGQTPEEGK